jgi:hypothetical protein
MPIALFLPLSADRCGNELIIFTLSSLLDIDSGRPSSSYYFVGYQGDDLFYLDPHHSRCVIESKSLNDYTAEVRPFILNFEPVDAGKQAA